MFIVIFNLAFLSVVCSTYIILRYIKRKRRRQFIRLLKELGLYIEYITNLKYIGMNHSKSNKFFSTCRPENYVLYAFNWTITKQGYAFWKKVNRMWEETIAGHKDYVTQADKYSLKVVDISKTYDKSNKK